MQGQAQLVVLGGLGLVGVNLWVGPQHTAIAGVLWGADGADPSDAHTAMLELGAELLFVVVAAIAAGVSSSTGTAMVAVMVALWVLWGIKYYTRNGTPKVAPTTQAKTAAARFPGQGGAVAAPAGTVTV